MTADAVEDGGWERCRCGYVGSPPACATIRERAGTSDDLSEEVLDRETYLNLIAGGRCPKSASTSSSFSLPSRPTVSPRPWRPGNAEGKAAHTALARTGTCRLSVGLDIFFHQDTRNLAESGVLLIELPA